MTTDLAPVQAFIDVKTGEVLPANVKNAAQVLLSAREMRERLNNLVTEATAYLVAESAQQGTRTLRQGDATISLSGGLSVEYDASTLLELLADAGCPQERIDEAVVAEVTYKINRTVLRSLSASNPDYRAAIELARREVERPYRASVK